jgi:hypothetical protein
VRVVGTLAKVNMMTRSKYRLELSVELYPHEAVLRAAATTLADCRYIIEKIAGPNAHYVITLDKSEPDDDNRTAIADFLRQLHEETLRYAIAARTSTLRNLLIGRALYQTCLQLPIAKGDTKGNAPDSANQ